MTSLKDDLAISRSKRYSTPMSLPKQLTLAGFEGLGVKKFGGSLLKGNPREARPISVKRPMHLVMRSTLATGRRSFLLSDRAREIKDLVHRAGRVQGVRVYRYANSGNHLHLIIMPRSRAAFHAFVRAISGLIARLTLERERGPARVGLLRVGATAGFWDARPFTRILEWGREFRGVADYLLRNVLEAAGFSDLLPPRKSARPPPVRPRPRSGRPRSGRPRTRAPAQ